MSSGIESLIGKRFMFPDALTALEWEALVDMTLYAPANLFCSATGQMLDVRKMLLTVVTIPPGSVKAAPEGGVHELYTHESAEIDLARAASEGWPVTQYRSRELLNKLRRAVKAATVPRPELPEQRTRRIV